MLALAPAADSGTATTQELLACADAADTRNMDELRASCLTEVARQLAAELDSLPAGGDSLLSAITRSSLLEGCSQRTLLLLFSIMTAAGKATHLPELRSHIPCKGAVVDALQRAPNMGTFEWALERFSEQPSAVGDKVESPRFAAAGKEWNILVYPGGETDATAGHLSGEWLHYVSRGGTFLLMLLPTNLFIPAPTCWVWHPGLPAQCSWSPS